MPQQTPVISFSLADIGRRHTGKKRAWNIGKLVGAINSPATQERVRNRDMLGYYGHWPRQRLGMTLAEGGVIDGKVVYIEPAHVTTMLRADDDGTVHHQAEFFDTAPGMAAGGAYRNKFGGFSTAINHDKPMFYGFDYVLEPNFTTNRPYTLDGVAEDDEITFDEVGEYLDSVNSAALLIKGFEQERTDLQAEIARLAGIVQDQKEIAEGRRATLDSLRRKPNKFDDADAYRDRLLNKAEIRGAAAGRELSDYNADYLALVTHGTLG